MSSSSTTQNRVNISSIIRHADSGINCLPEDILVEIFQYGPRVQIFHPNGITLPPRPILLSMVCRLWREVVISSPALWNRIIILNGVPDKTIIRFFLRSHPALIDITFMDEDYNDINYSLCSRLITSNMHRIRRLRVRAPSDAQVIALVGDLKGETTNLTEFCISIVNPKATLHGSHTSPIPVLDSLKTLRIKGICQLCIPPIVSLSHLEVAWLSISPNTIRAVLGSCVSLAKLSLRSFNLKDETEGESHSNEPIKIPSLRELSVSCETWCHSPVDGADKCDCILPLISADNLQVLDINSYDEFDFKHHLSACLSTWRNKSCLHTIRLRGLKFHQKVHVEFLSSLQKNISIEIYGDNTHSDPNVWAPYFLSLTNVSSITLQGFKPNIITKLQDLSIDRRSIMTVRLNKTWGTLAQSMVDTFAHVKYYVEEDSDDVDEEQLYFDTTDETPSDFSDEDDEDQWQSDQEFDLDIEDYDDYGIGYDDEDTDMEGAWSP